MRSGRVGGDEADEVRVLGDLAGLPAGLVLALDVGEADGPAVGHGLEVVAHDRHVGVDRGGAVRVLPDPHRPVVPAEEVLQDLQAALLGDEVLHALLEHDDQEAHSALLTVALEDVDVAHDVAGGDQVLEHLVHAGGLGRVRGAALLGEVLVERDPLDAAVALLLPGRVRALAQSEVVTLAALLLVLGLHGQLARGVAADGADARGRQALDPLAVDAHLQEREAEGEGLHRLFGALAVSHLWLLLNSGPMVGSGGWVALVTTSPAVD